MLRQWGDPVWFSRGCGVFVPRPCLGGFWEVSPAVEQSAPLQPGPSRLPAACPEESTPDLRLSAPSRAAHPAPRDHRGGLSGQSGCCPATDSPGTPVRDH